MFSRLLLTLVLALVLISISMATSPNIAKIRQKVPSIDTPTDLEPDCPNGCVDIGYCECGKARPAGTGSNDD